jgi:hypothetical protein
MLALGLLGCDDAATRESAAGRDVAGGDTPSADQTVAEDRARPDDAGDAKPRRGLAPSTDPGPLAYDPLGPEPSAVVQATVAHTRSTAPATVGMTVVNALELTQPNLARLRALAATAGVPEWAHAETWDPRAARDDDTRTTWRCKSTDDDRCGWIAALSEPAEIQVIRVVVGRGKVRQMRLHTDAGVVDLPPLPNAKPRYIVFEQPVRTASLAFEAARPGSLRLAEVEIYGVSGPAREPWTFDPTSAAVSAEEPWVAFDDAWRLGRYVCLSVLDDRVRAHCLFRGTAMYGRRDDRFALSEAVHRTDCASHSGVYVLLDRQTRRHIKLGSLGGLPSAIHLHTEGLGFASARPTGGYLAVVARSDELVEESYRDLEALVAAGFDREPSERGEFALRAPAACPEPLPFSHGTAMGSIEGDGGDSDGDPSVPPRTFDRAERPTVPALPRELASLPPSAREAVAEPIEDMCVDAVAQGNFEGTGLDDYLVHMVECDAKDAPRSVLLMRTDLGDYLALDVPTVGAGGRAAFDRLADGKPVLRLEDDCCGGHTVAIVTQGKGSVLEITRKYEAGAGESIDIVRDPKGRIDAIKVRRRRGG